MDNQHSAYSAQFKQLEQEHLDHLKHIHQSTRQDAVIRSKKLQQETNKRRKAQAQKRKIIAQREEKRRQEILVKRKQEIRDATERFQRQNRHYSEDQADLFQHEPTPPAPGLDDALRTVRAGYSRVRAASARPAARQLSRQDSNDSTSAAASRKPRPVSAVDTTRHHRTSSNDGKNHETKKTLHDRSLRNLTNSRSLFEQQLEQHQQALLHQTQQGLLSFNASILEEMERDQEQRRQQQLDPHATSVTSIDSLEAADDQQAFEQRVGNSNLEAALNINKQIPSSCGVIPAAAQSKTSPLTSNSSSGSGGGFMLHRGSPGSSSGSNVAVVQPMTNHHPPRPQNNTTGMMGHHQHTAAGSISRADVNKDSPAQHAYDAKHTGFSATVDARFNRDDLQIEDVLVEDENGSNSDVIHTDSNGRINGHVHHDAVVYHVAAYNNNSVARACSNSNLQSDPYQLNKAWSATENMVTNIKPYSSRTTSTNVTVTTHGFTHTTPVSDAFVAVQKDDRYSHTSGYKTSTGYNHNHNQEVPMSNQYTGVVTSNCINDYSSPVLSGSGAVNNSVNNYESSQAVSINNSTKYHSSVANSTNQINNSSLNNNYNTQASYYSQMNNTYTSSPANYSSQTNDFLGSIGNQNNINNSGAMLYQHFGLTPQQDPYISSLYTTDVSSNNQTNIPTSQSPNQSDYMHYQAPAESSKVSKSSSMYATGTQDSEASNHAKSHSNRTPSAHPSAASKSYPYNGQSSSTYNTQSTLEPYSTHQALNGVVQKTTSNSTVASHSTNASRLMTTTASTSSAPVTTANTSKAPVTSTSTYSTPVTTPSSKNAPVIKKAPTRDQQNYTVYRLSQQKKQASSVSSSTPVRREKADAIPTVCDNDSDSDDEQQQQAEPPADLRGILKRPGHVAPALKKSVRIGGVIGRGAHGYSRRLTTTNQSVSIRDSIEVNREHLGHTKATNKAGESKRRVRFWDMVYEEEEQVEEEQEGSEEEEEQENKQPEPPSVPKPAPQRPVSARVGSSSTSAAPTPTAASRAQSAGSTASSSRRRPPFLRPHPPTQPPSGRATMATPVTTKQPATRIPTAQAKQSSQSQHEAAASQQHEAAASQRRSVYDEHGVRLDRTPTDAEINWLWDKVRTCLHRETGEESETQVPAVRQSVNINTKVFDGNTLSPQLKVAQQQQQQQQQQRTEGSSSSVTKKKITMDTLTSFSRRSAAALLQQRKSTAGAATTHHHPTPQPATATPAPPAVYATVHSLVPTMGGEPPRYMSAAGASDAVAAGGYHNTTTQEQVTSSMAGFLAAETLASQHSVSESELEHALAEAANRQNVYNATRPQQHVSTALSIEEQRLMQSLDRLNERLKAQEAGLMNPPGLYVPRPPSAAINGFRGHQPRRRPQSGIVGRQQPTPFQRQVPVTAQRTLISRYR